MRHREASRDENGGRDYPIAAHRDADVMRLRKKRGTRTWKMTDRMSNLDALRKQGQMTWSEHEQGWNGTPHDIFRGSRWLRRMLAVKGSEIYLVEERIE